MKLNLKEKYLIILVVLCFISVAFYYSYAVFVTKQLQENVVLVKIENDFANLTINGNGNKILIKNNSSQDIKVSLNNKKTTNNNYLVLVKGLVAGVKVNSNDEIKGKINSLETKDLTIHIDNTSNSDVELEFIAKLSDNEIIEKDINYSYINSTDNYDHSNANKPEIDGLKLIPVSYKELSETDGFWYKTDLNNQTDLWYSYENGIWANAVLLSDSSYSKYKDANIGEKIEISDVLGFYVWIPRFKYNIINNSSYTNYERLSSVFFEEGNNTTGTVKCYDKINSINDDHIYSEVCSDEKYNHIYDNLSTYTHPSFHDKNGFWISKFLMGDNGKAIPNVNMMKKNIYYANTISKKYPNSHVLTNMEYGAVIILSNSSYGKTGNPLYSNDYNYTFTRIYANTYEMEVTGCASDYNSRSKSIITEKTNKCVQYNDLNNYSHVTNSISYPIGYAGAGASTTGTVYGVYDLANLNGEIVSAFVADKNGSADTETNYYDIYSYNKYFGKVYSSSNIYNLYRYKLGDAIKEHFRSFNEQGMWYNGVLIQNQSSGIIVRGSDASVYSASIEKTNYEAPFRLVLSHE